MHTCGVPIGASLGFTADTGVKCLISVYWIQVQHLDLHYQGTGIYVCRV